jgi:hypothetical protein
LEVRNGSVRAKIKVSAGTCLEAVGGIIPWLSQLLESAPCPPHLHNKKRLVLHSLLHSDLSCASLFPVRKEDITRGPPGLSRIIFQETSVYLLEVCWTVSAINLLSSFPVALWVYSVLNSATYILVMFQGDWE